MLRFLLLVLTLVFIFDHSSLESTTSQATITYSISAIDTLSVSGNPSTFSFSGATAGSQPLSLTDNSTTISLTTNSSTNRTLSAQLATALPAHAALTVNVAAGSSGGTSLGAIDVSDGASHNLVSAIKQAVANNMTVTYDFSITVQTPITATTNDVLTFTLQ